MAAADVVTLEGKEVQVHSCRLYLANISCSATIITVARSGALLLFCLLWRLAVTFVQAMQLKRKGTNRNITAADCAVQKNS